MIPKCGQKMIHHWAHKGKLECDHWWEPETPWHRDWKDNFPKEWQEIVHQDSETGERHIADVKTSLGIVLEFQHSPIKPEERKSRNEFYKNIVWVVDGKRLKRDEANFNKVLSSGISIGHVKKVRIDESSLLHEWSGMSVPVFLDFGQHHLWLIIPIVSETTYAYIFPLSKSDFLEIFRDAQHQKEQTFWNFLKEFVANITSPRPQVQKAYLTIPQRRYVRREPRINYLQKRNRKRRF